MVRSGLKVQLGYIEMNIFFHTTNATIQSTLTIPKYSNHGARAEDMKLYAARVKDGQFEPQECDSGEDDFWVVHSTQANKDDIYFIAKPEEVGQHFRKDQLVDLNKFTNTSPAYRANLEISNKQTGAFSSYQAEYPYRMTGILSSLYSDCAPLTKQGCKQVGVFIRNIYKEPICDARQITLFDKKHNNKLATFEIHVNRTNYLDLTDYAEHLEHSFLFAKDFIGIPIYMMTHQDDNLSFEHTHPPHESVSGQARMGLVANMKRAISEKIYS